MLKNSWFLGVVILFGVSIQVRAAETGTLIHIGLQLPLLESPALAVPAASSGSLGSLANTFTDLVEKLGIRAGLYPANLGFIHLGGALDVTWRYDMDATRSPFVIGYNHIGLGPSAVLDFSPLFFGQAVFGLNRMEYRYGDEYSFQLGYLAELSLGLRFGVGGKGFSVEGVFQNRTGISSVTYGLLRAGIFF